MKQVNFFIVKVGDKYTRPWDTLNLAMFYLNTRNKHAVSNETSAIVTPIDKSCMLLFNLWIYPIICWYSGAD